MPSLKSKIILSLLLSSALFSSEATSLEESIISKDRLEIIDLSKEQIDQNSSKLKMDWINPITYTYSKVYGEQDKGGHDTEKSFINIDQPIFKSGGIYQAIKYANASKLYSHLDIDLQKKALIKDTTTLLFQIHKIDLQIEKQKLLVSNGDIDIQRKKEQVLNGFADTSVLDSAILDANSAKNILADLIYQREELINSFNSYASGEYLSFKLPTLTLINKEDFLKSNLNISKSKADIEAKNNYAWMTIAKYLPTVSATFDYTKYHTTTNNALSYDNVQNYGIKVSMPLDIRTYNDVQSTRIDYLKSKLEMKNIVLEQENYFKTKLSKINMIESKMSIAKSDYELYNSLLSIIIEEKNAQLKTQSDVDTLSNSKKMKELDLKIYKIDYQIELLEIYSKIS